MTIGVARGLMAPVGIIGVYHAVAGVAVLAAPEAVKVTGFYGPIALFDDPIFVGFLAIIVGVMAILSRSETLSSEARRAMAMPQQLFLTAQFGGVVASIYAGAFPDGYVPVKGDYTGSVWFIIADQAELSAMFLSHSFELVCNAINPELQWYRQRWQQERDDRIACQQSLAARDEPAFWWNLANSVPLAAQSPCTQCPKIALHELGRS